MKGEVDRYDPKQDKWIIFPYGAERPALLHLLQQVPDTQSVTGKTRGLTSLPHWETPLPSL